MAALSESNWPSRFVPRREMASAAYRALWSTAECRCKHSVRRHALSQVWPSAPEPCATAGCKCTSFEAKP